MSSYQGGKAYGQLRTEQEEKLDVVNKAYSDDGNYRDEFENLDELLETYKKQFMEFDEDNSGDIDMMELKRMMEKMGQAKTHLELKKMIAEVDTTNSGIQKRRPSVDGGGTISYTEFLDMMLGKKSSVLKLILMFEEKKKEKELPSGPHPKEA